MASSFGGINTALTSLYAQRRGLDVTGQNIANANTEGYTRQRVDMQAQVGSIVPAHVGDDRRPRHRRRGHRRAAAARRSSWRTAGRTEHGHERVPDQPGRGVQRRSRTSSPSPATPRCRPSCTTCGRAWGDVGDQPPATRAPVPR